MTTPKILVALDGSKTSESVLTYAETLLRRRDADLTLLLVMPKDEPSNHRAGRAYLDGVADRLRRKGAVLDVHVSIGRPAEQIAAFAVAGAYDLVLLCTRGKTGLKRVLFGSTAEEVLRLCSVPVLAVPPQADRTEPAAIRRILLPHDGSHRSGAAVRPAADLALAHEAKLCFVTVVSPTKKDELPVETVAANLFRQQKELQKEGLEVEVAVLYGEPAERILAYADETGADLLALSTHGRSGLDRVVYGSVADALLRKGRRPLLVVRTAAVPKTVAKSAAALRAKHRAFEKLEEGAVRSRTAYGR
jgi:nucleotide-binding universal stress UspA family protein